MRGAAAGAVAHAASEWLPFRCGGNAEPRLHHRIMAILRYFFLLYELEVVIASANSEHHYDCRT